MNRTLVLNTEHRAHQLRRHRHRHRHQHQVAAMADAGRPGGAVAAGTGGDPDTLTLGHAAATFGGLSSPLHSGRSTSDAPR